MPQPTGQVHRLAAKGQQVFGAQALHAAGQAVGQAVVRLARDQHVVTQSVEALGELVELFWAVGKAVEDDKDVPGGLPVRPQLDLADGLQGGILPVGKL